MMKKYYLLFALSVFALNAFGQGSNASQMDPFCAGGSTLTFPSATGTAITPSDAQNFGCLFTQPNPAWFYMQVGTSGNLVFNLQQSNTNGVPIDVDFITWGPFPGPPPISGPTNLNSNTQVDCSYSGSAVEQIDIPGAQSGQYYVVLITNFNGSAGQISLTQTNVGQPGAGTTSCAILCPLSLGEDFTLCPNTTANITAQFTPQGTYNPALTTIVWTGPNGPIPSANNTLSLNISAPGSYTVTITNPACGPDPITDTVVVTAPDPMPISDPDDITICATGAAPYTFNLESNTPVILGNEDPNNYQVFYYLTQADAVEGFPIITNSSAYPSPGQGETIWVGVMDYFTLCTEIKSFQLFANPAPQPGQPDDLFACDVNNDGVEQFDLTAQDADVLAGQDPNVNILTYHTSATEAENNTGAIQAPETFVTGDVTIYVRMTNVDDEDCYSTTSFGIDVTPLPEPEAPADAFVCSDEPYLLPELEEGNYFDQPGGPDGGGLLLSAGDPISETMTIYVYAEEGVAPNICSGEDSFVVTVYEKPVVDTPAEVFACESYILPGLNVGQYYTGPGGTGDVVAASTEITTTTTLYVYAQTGTVGTIICSDEHVLNINIDNAPTVGTATALEQCDVSNDGYALFNLTLAGAEVIGNQTGLEVTYHATPEDAAFGDNDITNPTAWQNAVIEDFDDAEHPFAYIRIITAGTTTNCATVVPVTLIVHPRPVIAPITPYILCDDNNSPDGVEIFDLTTKNSEATNNATDIVTYYLTQEQAIAGTDAIASPESFESATAQIWVRVENTFGCSQVAPIQLTVNPLPVIATNMEPFYACEDTPGVGIFNFDEIDPVITQGAAGYTVVYYLTEGQALLGEDDYLVSEYPSPNATIFARVEDAVTGCAIVSPVVLEVLPAPIAPELEPLQECDPNNDGIATFDLTESIALIQAALGNTVVVTVHETPEDADFGTNIVTNTSSYTNNAQIWTQTLWLRVESSQTECFDVVTLQLIVNPVPEATEPAEAYEMCDNGSNDSDGIAVFDLTQYGPIVLGSLNPAQFSVSYHASYDNAVNNITIPTPASFNSPSVPAIFIKVTNNTTGCYDIVELELIVNPLPIAVQPTPLTLCDENNPGNQVEIFDLTSKIDEITESAFGVTVTFHDTYAQAVGNTDAITTPEAYPNSTPAVETIFVRVTNNETGCYRIVLLDIRVEPLPILVEPTEADLTECDTTGLGFAQFNLTELVEDMINNGVGITVAFYETEQNALDGILPISNPGSYTNAIAYEHTIYVKASSANGCQSEVYALTLHVAPAPQAPDLEDIVLCDDQDTNNQNGMAFIDLTIYEQDIYTATGAAPGTLTIHYFTTEEAADAGAPRITTPAHYNASNDQIIWVRVELAETGCYSLTRFTVKFNLPVDVVTPTMLVKCDDTLPLNDAQATFDLTQKDNEILGPLGIGLGNTVAYFETQANATNNTSPITPATAYTNPLGQNPKTLFVRVTTPQGCVSYTTLTVKVLPLPVPDTTPDALELCDITNTGDNVESFDLTQAEDDIANNDNAVTFNYYPTQADAIAEPPTNEIIPATAYVSGTGSVWVRVSASNGNANDPICYSVVELPLIVHPLPAQSAIVPYAICEQNTDGFATFDLGSQIAQILGPDADPADYMVTFRYNGNLISYSYTNVVANSQVIDVRVVHNGTGCTATVQLTLLVEEQAIAYDVTTPDFDLCDTDGDNDGALIIDLTQATADIIGTQDPAIHSVTYYPSEADALAQTNAIDNPAAYNATTLTIWAEIINTSTLSGCPDYTSFEVVIELLPEPEISTADDVRTICVDFDTQEVLRPLELRSGVTPNGHTYDWYLDGALVGTTTNGTYLAEAPGTYTVIVTGPAPNGCVSDESEGFTVIQSGPASPIGIGYTVSNAFGDSQVITVLVEGYGEYQYSLYEEGPWQNSNVFTDVAPGAHTIFVRDVTEDACDTLVLDEVSIINYPHYFTPNADGYNDTWNVIGLAGEEYQAIVYIFDRYGKLIKQISPDGEGWDGTFNGTKVPADDYWFTVEFTEGLNRREFKAHFALKR